MKKRAIVLILALVICLGTAVWAADGEALVSLSYLRGAFTDGFLAQLDGSGDRIYEKAQQQVDAIAAQAGLGPEGAVSQLTEVSLKEKDRLTASAGAVVLPLAGSLQVTFSAGTVVDATEGRELSSGTLLSPSHRYVVAEGTSAVFTVASQVAVFQYEGICSITESAETVDYIAMADALKALHLFQGSDTGYGNGYNLDRYPTRLQALVMFLRVLGEEDAALAYTGSHPFTDVPWGDSYVAYAYSKGYTNGYGDGRFGSDNPVSAASYVEFLLRALGYSTAGVDDWRTSLTRAVGCGLITDGERQALESGEFYRAQVVYLSYHSLDAPVSGTAEQLGDRLVRQGLFTASQLQAARSGVSPVRLG